MTTRALAAPSARAQQQVEQLDIRRVIASVATACADAKQYSFAGELQLIGQRGETGRLLTRAKVRLAIARGAGLTCRGSGITQKPRERRESDEHPNEARPPMRVIWPKSFRAW